MNVRHNIIKIFKRVFPYLQKYLWFVASANKVATFDFPKMRFLQEQNIEIIHITDALVEAIEKSRPGYSGQAAKYLAHGHVGLAATLSGKVLGMIWLFCNHSSQTVRAGYFPLGPRMAWIHALWVHPDYRGLGLSQVLIIWGARVVSQVLGDEALIEANVLPENSISVKVFRKLGFTVHGHLYLIRWAKWSFAWKTKAGKEW